MQKTRPLLMLFCALLLVVGCTQKNSADPPVKSEVNGGTDEKNVKDHATDEEKADQAVSMINYFLPDGSKAHYEGDGNEFAELDIEVAHIDQNYVVIDENNGGALIRKIYHVGDDKIVTLSEDAIDVKEPLPTKEALSKLGEKEIYLQKPFEVGAAFDQWTIVETDASIEAPFQKFDHVLVIEMKENDFTNRKYFAENFGEIKRESVLITQDEEDFVVKSTLESVNQ